MAWSEADQNPSLSPTANATPTYAQTLNAYSYGASGSSSAAPSATRAGGGRDYARQLATAAAPARRATSRALEQSAQGTAPAAPGLGYTVQRGDNLTKIGRRFGVSAAEIASANGIRNPNRIGIGQQLMIPGAGGEVDIPSPRMRPPRQSEADRIDAATRVDANGNYVQAPQQQRPGMQPVRDRNAALARLGAQSPVDLSPAEVQQYAMDRAAPNLGRRPPRGDEYTQMSIDRPPRTVPRNMVVPPSPVDSTTGTWNDLPDPTPQGYSARPADQFAGRFADAFDAPAPGTIMDLRPAYESRPPINQPPGQPLFVTPSGIRVWAAR